MNRRQALKCLASLALVGPLLTCEKSSDGNEKIVHELDEDTGLIKSIMVSIGNEDRFIPVYELL